MKPALTAEEWAIVRAHPHLMFGISGHGRAAQYLYGQPFGFTREMVNALRVILRNWDGLDLGDERDQAEYVGDELRPLAEAAIENLEALLPQASIARPHAGT